MVFIIIIINIVFTVSDVILAVKLNFYNNRML